ncbi:hypothetical protein A1OE_790 [Candidatus Endolissoclinum faulkneri L2]|uniref:Uncharacterized protein n=1 Tax=Candidatus Endolissoclinum faulkneri L2 TaxID=1193729 RepID=K7YHF0_9PROT|nr:hypothetical protein A1OE_790 [Candidatus Endolissoclinum faulkneri L2]
MISSTIRYYLGNYYLVAYLYSELFGVTYHKIITYYILSILFIVIF